MEWTTQDIELMESWWIQKSRVNFLAYRQFLRYGNFLHGWFITDLCKNLQDFYTSYIKGERPILIINTPPQHGKSWSIADFITWMTGRDPTLRIIYGSFSDKLGIRCNLYNQRTYDSRKFKAIFPNFNISRVGRITIGKAKRNHNLIEFWNENKKFGYFRNTTVQGSITGETLDIGVIDDPVKGRAEANSIVTSEKIWDWYNDDFSTRFADKAGLILIMTRWAVNDLAGRLIKKKKNIKLLNYSAIATKEEEYRSCGDVLFPELKTVEFLLDKKFTMNAPQWESLYQGSPTVTGGNIFKDNWWCWWKILPQIKYKFITADTAQKTKTQSDWTIFQCWGYGIDDRIYLLDKLREKFEAPELRREAEIFYQKHDTPRINLADPTLRGMYIEDKSSGTGLLQELRKKKLKVIEVPRNTDKVFRAEDTIPYVESGRVVLNTEIPEVGNLTKEARDFPNGEFDDDIDTLMTAIEVAFINKNNINSLQAAMEAD